MNKLIQAGAGVVVGLLFAFLIHLLPAQAEECVQEKLQVQNLLQQNAQLNVAVAQQQFRQAMQEKARLEGITKDTTPPPAPTPAPSPAEAAPPQPSPHPDVAPQ